MTLQAHKSDCETVSITFMLWKWANQSRHHWVSWSAMWRTQPAAQVETSTSRCNYSCFTWEQDVLWSNFVLSDTSDITDSPRLRQHWDAANELVSMCVGSLVSLGVCMWECGHTLLSTERWLHLLLDLRPVSTTMGAWRKCTHTSSLVPRVWNLWNPPSPQPSLLTSPETIIPTQQPPPPPLLNGCGWDGVKVITGPWIFVPTHFISVRLPTGKSMSSALMKDLHLCPMDLLVLSFLLIWYQWGPQILWLMYHTVCGMGVRVHIVM